tara:strand:- start:672 stop:1367 length:696 start_codon:yes stop_codon:yes gene_type:complete
LISPFVAILPSAGSGSRFNSEIPKQYCSIGDKKIIEFSLDLLAEVDECQAICIPVSKKDLYHKEIQDHPKFHFIEGGSSRAESVKKGVDFLDLENLNYDNILIHDPVRPCITKTELRRMLVEFFDGEFQALILAVPVSDTLKLSKNNYIKGTISRENMWRALTPQLFTKEALKNAYNLNSEDLSNLTDEASLFDNLDEEVMIMRGSSENIKITFQEDLKLAENILFNQNRI